MQSGYSMGSTGMYCSPVPSCYRNISFEYHPMPRSITLLCLTAPSASGQYPCVSNQNWWQSTGTYLHPILYILVSIIHCKIMAAILEQILCNMPATYWIFWIRKYAINRGKQTIIAVGCNRNRVSGKRRGMSFRGLIQLRNTLLRQFVWFSVFVP